MKNSCSISVFRLFVRFIKMSISNEYNRARYPIVSRRTGWSRSTDGVPKTTTHFRPIIYCALRGGPASLISNFWTDRASWKIGGRCRFLCVNGLWKEAPPLVPARSALSAAPAARILFLGPHSFMRRIPSNYFFFFLLLLSGILIAFEAPSQKRRRDKKWRFKDRHRVKDLLYTE